MTGQFRFYIDRIPEIQGRHRSLITLFFFVCVFWLNWGTFFPYFLQESFFNKTRISFALLNTYPVYKYYLQDLMFCPYLELCSRNNSKVESGNFQLLTNWLLNLSRAEFSSGVSNILHTEDFSTSFGWNELSQVPKVSKLDFIFYFKIIWILVYLMLEICFN